MVRITESQLILPSLYLMNLEKDGYITTSKLKQLLPKIMNPSWEDTEISKTRKNETKFIQIIWNLKSHKTFLRDKLATEQEKGFKITKKWKKYLSENIDLFEYLVSNNFEWEDLKEWLEIIYKNTIIEKWKVEIFDENIVISEWIEKVKKVKVYDRSTKLRSFAIEHFKKGDWKLYCECCWFSFDLFYWEKMAKNYIEIHHKKPIFQYVWEDITNTITEALKNLSPLCSNCHRIIHREKNTKEISDVIDAIKENWKFI